MTESVALDLAAALEAAANHPIAHAITARAEQLITDATGALVGDGDVELLLNAAPHRRSGVPALGIGPDGCACLTNSSLSGGCGVSPSSGGVVFHDSDH